MLKQLSDQEQRVLDDIGSRKKADVMADYLLALSGNKNMSELGVKYFGGENYSHYVSLIT